MLQHCLTNITGQLPTVCHDNFGPLKKMVLRIYVRTKFPPLHCGNHGKLVPRHEYMIPPWQSAASASALQRECTCAALFVPWSRRRTNQPTGRQLSRDSCGPEYGERVQCAECMKAESPAGNRRFAVVNYSNKSRSNRKKNLEAIDTARHNLCSSHSLSLAQPFARTNRTPFSFIFIQKETITYILFVLHLPLSTP